MRAHGLQWRSGGAEGWVGRVWTGGQGGAGKGAGASRGTDCDGPPEGRQGCRRSQGGGAGWASLDRRSRGSRQGCRRCQGDGLRWASRGPAGVPALPGRRGWVGRAWTGGRGGAGKGAGAPRGQIAMGLPRAGRGAGAPRVEGLGERSKILTLAREISQGAPLRLRIRRDAYQNN